MQPEPPVDAPRPEHFRALTLRAMADRVIRPVFSSAMTFPHVTT